MIPIYFDELKNEKIREEKLSQWLKEREEREEKRKQEEIKYNEEIRRIRKENEQHSHNIKNNIPKNLERYIKDAQNQSNYNDNNQDITVPPIRKPISNKLKHEIWRRDKFTCQYCGKDIDEVDLEIDHIKPVAKGGTNAVSNLQTLCFDCNRSKGAK